MPSDRVSSRATRFSTSPVVMRASGKRSSRGVFATAGSTRRRRWSRRRGSDSAAEPRVELGDLNDFVPPSPVAATTVFRAIYYASDRRRSSGTHSAITEKKLVFDLNPRQYRIDDVVADLRAAGFASVALRPFFVPQTVSLPRPILAAAKALERSGPLARSRSACASPTSWRLPD